MKEFAQDMQETPAPKAQQDQEQNREQGAKEGEGSDAASDKTQGRRSGGSFHPDLIMAAKAGDPKALRAIYAAGDGIAQQLLGQGTGWKGAYVVHKPIPSSLAVPFQQSTNMDLSDVTLAENPLLEKEGKRGVARDGKCIEVALECGSDAQLCFHELAHIAQQRGGTIRAKSSEISTDLLEQEATAAISSIQQGKVFALSSAMGRQKEFFKEFSFQDFADIKNKDELIADAELIISDIKISGIFADAVKDKAFAARVNILSPPLFIVASTEYFKLIYPNVDATIIANQCEELVRSGKQKGFHNKFSKDIFLLEGQGNNLYILLHETLHLLSSDTLNTRWGTFLNEGITDTFLREIMLNQCKGEKSSIKALTKTYDEQVFLAGLLAEKTKNTFDLVYVAYFEGNLTSFENNIVAALRTKKIETRLELLADHSPLHEASRQKIINFSGSDAWVDTLEIMQQLAHLTSFSDNEAKGILIEILNIL